MAYKFPRLDCREEGGTKVASYSVPEARDNYLKKIVFPEGEPGLQDGVNLIRATLLEMIETVPCGGTAVFEEEGKIAEQMVDFLKPEIQKLLATVPCVTSEEALERESKVLKGIYDMGERTAKAAYMGLQQDIRVLTECVVKNVGDEDRKTLAAVPVSTITEEELLPYVSLIKKMLPDKKELPFFRFIPIDLGKDPLSSGPGDIYEAQICSRALYVSQNDCLDFFATLLVNSDEFWGAFSGQPSARQKHQGMNYWSNLGNANNPQNKDPVPIPIINKQPVNPIIVSSSDDEDEEDQTKNIENKEDKEEHVRARQNVDAMLKFLRDQDWQLLKRNGNAILQKMEEELTDQRLRNVLVFMIVPMIKQFVQYKATPEKEEGEALLELFISEVKEELIKEKVDSSSLATKGVLCKTDNDNNSGSSNIINSYWGKFIWTIVDGLKDKVGEDTEGFPWKKSAKELLDSLGDLAANGVDVGSILGNIAKKFLIGFIPGLG